MPITEHQLAHASSLREFKAQYTYDRLKKVYPWACTFRAGFILIRRQPSLQMLFVKQRPVKTPRRSMPARFGLPKGGREPEDADAFDTAARELTEETSVNIYDIPAAIAPTTFIVERLSKHMRDVAIYFAAFIADADVNTCTYELEGHQWVDIREGLQAISPVTHSTKMLIDTLNNVDFWADFTPVGIAE